MKRLGVVIILALAFCGLADSAYLAQHELSGAPLICNIGGLSGCNIVAQSAYSHLFGVPLAEYGLLFYAAVFALAALELAIFDRVLRRVLQGFALVGLAASVFFTLVQVLLIQALCAYCLGSAVIALLVFVFSTFIEPIRPNVWRKAPSSLPPPPFVPPSPPPFTMPPSA